MGDIVACTNQKGGVGKTTTVVNLATYLALEGHPTLVIDLDPQGNCTSGLGVDRASVTASTYDGLIAGRAPAELVRPTAVDGLALIPAAAALAGLEVELAPLPQRERRLAGLLQSETGRYDYDGDASRLAHLLDPTRLGSPLHQFRTEVSDGFSKLNERLTAIEAASAARAAERARSAAKGGDFEDLLEEMLGAVARGAGDILERTSDDAGSVMKSKKGDFLVTVDPAVTRGGDVKIVVEAKDRPMSARAIRDELREARENRGAAVGIAVFTPAHAPAGVEPFTVVAGDVYCVVDPASPEPALLEAAVRLARLLALATLRDAAVEVNAQAISAAVTGIREQVEVIRRMKTQLTSVGNVTREIAVGLDRLREGVLARVCEVETELRVVEAAAGRGVREG